jgi:hypothetical protein
MEFSCEKNTLGFNQPRGRHLTSSKLWQRRDELVEKVISIINSTPIYKHKEVGFGDKEYSKICSAVKELKEIDSEWHLVITQQGEKCLRICHYDCYCNSGDGNNFREILSEKS